ncbi:salicylate hydroxylase [Xylogone sp. PMI_703]|nr:salicylate hydroxylase [Xylogone sp. PMI_703]
MNLQSSTVELEPRPLKIIIIGGGIAGFSTAISCRRAGHNVTIYERSFLDNETGAVISIAPNVSRILLAWGFDPVRARMVKGKRSWRAYTTTLEKFHVMEHGNATEDFGAPFYFVHRADFQGELRMLATEERGEGPPVVVHLKTPVTKYILERGAITILNNKEIAGDLIIAADADDRSMKFFVDPEDFSKKVVWYPCRNNEVQNFALIQRSDEIINVKDWQIPSSSDPLLDTFSNCHPAILSIIKKATEIKKWPLLFRPPINTWHRGKLLVVGDAAHPMLPPSVMQIFSNAGQEQAEKVKEDAARYMAVEDVPKSPDGFIKHNFGYNVAKEVIGMMLSEYPNWKLPTNFFDSTQGKEVHP